MKELKNTFDLLYKHKRLLIKNLDTITESILILQTKCEHEVSLETKRCSICGKLLEEL